MHGNKITLERATILVTGGAGFIGSHLCEALRAHYPEARVISLDNYFTGLKENHISGVEYHRGHTRDIASLIAESPDVVFHLGEYARVERSLEEPDVVLDSNIRGTAAVLEFCRKHASKIVYAGSSTKFGDGGLSRDQSPYAWTKAANTELVRNYGEWYGLPHAIAYFYNVYGPRERAGTHGTVIEIFRQQHKSGEPLTVVTPGTQKRNFTHVSDIVGGLILVGERGFGDEYGLGARQAYSILEIAEMFGAEIKMLPERKGNRMTSGIDLSKTERELGWEARRDVKNYINDILAQKSA